MAKKDEVKEKETKASAKEVVADIGTTKDNTAETYTRRTPFGVETWDPKTKSTTMSVDGKVL